MMAGLCTVRPSKSATTVAASFFARLPVDSSPRKYLPAAGEAAANPESAHQFSTADMPFSANSCLARSFLAR